MPKPRTKISVDKLYACEILSDTDAGTVYGAPRWLEGVNAISYNPNTQSASWDADGGTYETYSSDGEVQTTITIADLNPADYAWLMGVQITNEGLISEGMSDNPIECAIGFRSEKSNGEYRFVWILKGKFAKQQEDYSTKGSAGVTFQPRTIMHTAMNRTSDNMKRHWMDSDYSGNTISIAELTDATTGWFSSPNFDPASYVGSTTPVSSLAASTGTNAGEITVAFTAPTGATNTAVQVSDGGEWVTMLNLSSGNSGTITGLKAGGQYLVRLYVTGGTNAGISNIDSATAGA